jgi:hypothetical protein
LNLPAAHPSTFSQVDERTGLAWTDDKPFGYDHLEAAPDGPGVIVFTVARQSETNRVVWAEAPLNIRQRMLELLARPQGEQPPWMPAQNLWFRATQCEGAGLRELALWLALEQRRLSAALAVAAFLPRMAP